MMHHKKIFLLLATQRSGSTMICEDFRNTGVMGIPEEYFIPWHPDKEVNWERSLTNIIKTASTENDVCAIKIMANQIPLIDACLKMRYKDTIEINNQHLFPYFTAVFAKALPIVIRRQDVLKQAISRHISRKTGVNHATGKKTEEHFAGNLMKGYDDSYNKKVDYSFEALSSEVTKIANENVILSKVVKDMNVSRPLSLYYEQIIQNGQSYLNRVAKYMKIDMVQEVADRKMVKLSNSKNDELYEAYILDYVHKYNGL